MNRESKMQWREDIRAAEELMYPKEVIEQLEKEPDAVKRANILSRARNATYKKRRKR